MLLLDRKAGEVIVISPGEPDEVRITVLEVHSEKVRLGLSADESIPIMRSELLHRNKSRQNTEINGDRQ